MMAIYTCLKNIFDYIELNKIRDNNIVESCSNIDDQATKELRKDETFLDYFAGW